MDGTTEPQPATDDVFMTVVPTPPTNACLLMVALPPTGLGSSAQSPPATDGPTEGTAPFSRSQSQLSTNSSASSVGQSSSQSLASASPLMLANAPPQSSAATLVTSNTTNSVNSAIASICTTTSNTAVFVAGDHALLSNPPDAANSPPPPMTSTRELPSVSSSASLQQVVSNADARAPSSTPKKRKGIFHNAFVGSYRSKCDDFRRIFKDPVGQERLLCDYACAFHSDILLQGRMYISLGFVCFYAKILGFETKIALAYKDVLSIVKEKTALVIPNAIRITVSEAQKAYFFTSFTSRDRTFVILHRLWQNALQNKSLSGKEFWHAVHALYGPNVDMTTADHDYGTYLEFVAARGLDEPLALCDLLSENQNQRVLMMKQRNELNRVKSYGMMSKSYRKSNRTKEATGESPRNVSPTSPQQTKNGSNTAAAKTDPPPIQDHLTRKPKSTRNKSNRQLKTVPKFTIAVNEDIPQLPLGPIKLESNSSDEIDALSDKDMHYQDCYSDPEPFCNQQDSFVCRVETDDMNTLRLNPLLLVDGKRNSRSRSASRKHTLQRSLTAEHTVDRQLSRMAFLELQCQRPASSAAVEGSVHSSCDEAQNKPTNTKEQRTPSATGSSVTNEEPRSSADMLSYFDDNFNDHAYSDSDDDEKRESEPAKRERHTSEYSDTFYCSQHEHFDLVLLDQPVALPATYLFECLTNADGCVYADLNSIKKHKNFVAEPWTEPVTQNEPAAARRTVRYLRAVEMPGIRATARVTEEHTSFISGKANPRRGIYYILVYIRNAGIPYAESFHVEQQYCVRAIDGETAHLVVTARYRFDKEVGFMKGIISRNCENGIRDSFKHWSARLLDEARRYREEHVAVPLNVVVNVNPVAVSRSAQPITTRQKMRAEKPPTPVLLRRSKRSLTDTGRIEIALNAPVLSIAASPTDSLTSSPLTDADCEQTSTCETPAPNFTNSSASCELRQPAAAHIVALSSLICEPFKWLILTLYAVSVLFGQATDRLMVKHEMDKTRSREAAINRLISSVLYALLIVLLVVLMITNYALHTKLTAIEHLLIELRADLERSRNTLSS